MKEAIEYLVRHHFTCNETSGGYDCKRADGLGFRIVLDDRGIIISPEGHEEDLEELEDPEDVAIEYEGLLSDLKTILYKKGYRVKDEVSSFMEETLYSK